MDQAGVDRHALAADKALGDAARNRRLEQVPQQLAVTKPTVAVLGEGRVIRHPVGKIEAAEPAIRQVQMHLLAQPTLGPDAKAIADQQHADQQFGIDRWPPRVAVEIGEVRADAAQIDKPVDGSKQVVLRDVILQGELVEQRWLRLLPRSHHRRSSRPLAELNQHDVPRSSASFSTE